MKNLEDVFSPFLGWRSRLDEHNRELSLTLRMSDDEESCAQVIRLPPRPVAEPDSTQLARIRAQHTLLTAMAQYLNAGCDVTDIQSMASHVAAAVDQYGFQMPDNFKLLSTVDPVPNRTHLFLNDQNNHVILFEEDNCTEQYTLEEFINRLDEEEALDETPEF